MQEKLSLLRQKLKELGLNGFLVPQADPFQGDHGQHMPEIFARLAYLTGFEGSLGMLVVLQDKVAFFTDSRYTLAAGTLFQNSNIPVLDIAEAKPESWLGENTKTAEKIGYDPHLHKIGALRKLEEELPQLEFVPLDKNPIDTLRDGSSDMKLAEIVPFPQQYAGTTTAAKLQKITEQVKKEKANIAILHRQDAIAWLLNIRSEDGQMTPWAFSYALLDADTGTLDWFVDAARLTAEARAQLGNSIRTIAPDKLAAALQGLGGKTVLLDENDIAVWFKQQLEAGGANIKHGRDVTFQAKACKNEAERNAMRAAHIRDGAAWCKFLHWLDGKKDFNDETEVTISDQLQKFRKEYAEFRGLSFAPISGWAGNGAIVHYKPEADSCAPITQDNILLLDSGAQYIDGTTDMTRVIPIGKISQEIITAYTAVLKGHIALANAVFPEGTTGAQLDGVTRAPLWQHGYDFGHGTGHGVGVYLSVHEDSATISPRGQEALREGMILSNEPGYYKAGAFGIRIENLQLVVSAGENKAGKKMLRFEPLTLIPYDKRLIDFSMLNENEKDYMVRYYKLLMEKVSPLLDNETAAWLQGFIA